MAAPVVICNVAIVAKTNSNINFSKVHKNWLKILDALNCTTLHLRLLGQDSFKLCLLPGYFKLRLKDWIDIGDLHAVCWDEDLGALATVNKSRWSGKVFKKFSSYIFQSWWKNIFWKFALQSVLYLEIPQSVWVALCTFVKYFIFI